MSQATLYYTNSSQTTANHAGYFLVVDGRYVLPIVDLPECGNSLLSTSDYQRFVGSGRDEDEFQDIWIRKATQGQIEKCLLHFGVERLVDIADGRVVRDVQQNNYCTFRVI